MLILRTSALVLIVLTLPLVAGEAERSDLRCEDGVAVGTPIFARDLPTDIQTHFARAATRLNTTPEALLAPLDRVSQKRYFTREKFVAVLNALLHIVTDDNARAFRESWRRKEPQLGSATDRMILYINPICSECDHALALVLALRETCSGTFPSLVIRTAPDPTSSSRDAAIALEMIRETTPERYIEASTEFLNVLAYGGTLPGLLVKYQVDHQQASSTRRKSIVSALEEEKKLLAKHNMYPPVLIYRGRPIQRYETSTGDAFDPLRDGTNLSITLMLIASEIEIVPEKAVSTDGVQP
jgi:hypothetical protein